MDPRAELTLETDSKYVLNILENHQKLEDRGFIVGPHAKLVQSAITSFKLRPTQTRMVWVKGHNGHQRNEEADRLAGAAVQKDKASFVNLSLPPELNITGAKLSTISQALAYRAIMDQKSKDSDMYRKRTDRNLMRIKNCIEDMFGYLPTSEAIWKSIRHKDFELKIQIFLWKAIHDAYWIGDRWRNASMREELQERAICQVCGEVDDMTHILTKCQSPGQELVWKLAGELWKSKESGIIQWRDLTIGDILGCGLSRINKRGSKKPLTGETRLWKILVAHSAYLIWTMRCERVIHNEGRPFSESEVRNRWVKAINGRLDLDRNMTSQRYEKKALSKRLVLQTWKRVLMNEENLPKDWTDGRIDGVLVGITGSDRDARGVG
ncbi:hypothetical protein F5050DRAFT_1797644 [Lentinula boryana]|uniref:RNase H type-1 domain-containing protein n=1 Tax=Lentinula boryana TaxID=40481 RepID=A0ABQ8QMW6_9AGAR|nr:hypothetical protein F5050DRAFT_1797644 [Lentinula boryana]